MKITLKDGREIEMAFAAGATGYVAEKIEITADDVAAMLTMATERPRDFYAHMMQLEYRFSERRTPRVEPVPDPLAKMRLNAEPPLTSHARSTLYDPGFAASITETGRMILEKYSKP